MKLKVGIIGCGSMASFIDDDIPLGSRGGMVKPYALAGGFAKVDDVQMVATCNHTEPKVRAFQEKWDVSRGYLDYRDLIDTEKPDILGVATWPEQRAEIMVYGAEHGVKGMYAEKPLCLFARRGRRHQGRLRTQRCVPGVRTDAAQLDRVPPGPPDRGQR